jgi:hypothetical protein
MDVLVYRLRDHLVLGVRKRLEEAYCSLSRCGFKCNVNDVVVVSHCLGEELSIS